MNSKLSATSLAVFLIVPVGSALAQAPEFKFSGFGTIAVVNSDERNGDYVGSRFQPNGAGRTRSTDFGPDTKLGAQMAVKFDSKWSAVVQAVAQHQYDNGWMPQLEWANVKYQITDGLSVRAGRIALPSYLLSESRFVGYASPWAHPPGEVYSVLAVTANDGVDATWRHRFGDVNNALQVFYGKGLSKLPTGSAKGDPTWGFNNAMDIGSLTLRAGYTSVDLNLQISNLDALFGGLRQFAAGAGAVQVPIFQSAATQALALVEKYRLDSMKLSAVVLGAQYDPGDWFLMSEYVAFKGDGFLVDSTSWYVTGGWRIGAFTPYGSVARTRAKVPTEPGIMAAGTPLAAGAAGLNAGLNATLRQFNGSQDTGSIGIRWDAMPSVAVKAQYEQIRVKDGSNGRFANIAPGTSIGPKVNLITLAVDFVF